MSVSVDLRGTSNSFGNATSFSITPGTVSASATALASFIAFAENTTPPASLVVKWASQTLSAISGADSGDIGGAAVVAIRAVMHGIASPTSGSQTYTGNWLNSNSGYMDVESYLGSDTTTPFKNGTTANNQTGTSTSVSTTVNSPTGDWAAGICAIDNNNGHTLTITVNQNQIFKDATTSNGAAFANDTTGAGASTTLSGTLSNGSIWATAAADVAAAAVAGNPNNQYDWPNPQRTIWYRSWELAKMPPQPAKINRLNDWPIPPRTYWYMHEQNRLHIPNPALINRNNDWPVPAYSIPVYWDKFCFNTTPQVQPSLINRQNDWPVPAYQLPRYWDLFYFNRLSIPNPSLINRQNDWPNPQPVTWYRDWAQSLLQSTLSSQQAPFSQTNWPNPVPITWYQSWTGAIPLTPPPQVIVENLWDIPQPVKWYESWEFNGVLLFSQQQTPFSQTDWPLPRGNPRPDEFYSFSNVQFISQQPASFFNNYDWQNPPRVVWDKYWAEGIPQGALQKPFNQNDWPLPYPISWYQWFYQNLVPYLPSAILPFNQYDWPLPKTSQPIDQTWLQALVLNLPEPPPPIAPLGGGRWISPQEVISSIARKYGSIGGLASADSRTAAERKTLASIAAAHRWKK